MYYLTFFINYRPFLEKKIEGFLGRDLSEVFINDNGEDDIFLSIQDLPEHTYQSNHWYLHGSYLRKSPNQHSLILLSEQNISIQQSDEFLQYLSINYSWAIFSWGTFLEPFF